MYLVVVVVVAVVLVLVVLVSRQNVRVIGGRPDRRLVQRKKAEDEESGRTRENALDSTMRNMLMPTNSSIKAAGACLLFYIVIIIFAFPCLLRPQRKPNANVHKSIDSPRFLNLLLSHNLISHLVIEFPLTALYALAFIMSRFQLTSCPDKKNSPHVMHLTSFHLGSSQNFTFKAGEPRRVFGWRWCMSVCGGIFAC